MKRIIAALSCVCALAFASLGLAADGPGTSAVRRANEAVAELLKRPAAPGSEAEKKLVSEIGSRLKGFLDVEELGERALVDHWDKLTASQRQQYLSLLRALVEQSYVRVLRNNRDYEVKYLEETPEGESLRVVTELVLKKPDRSDTISIEYLLRNDGGTWRAFDLITDGVGLVENYRAQFNKIMAKEGFDGLLERMRKKRDAGQG